MQHQVTDKESTERNRWQIMIIDYDKNPNLTVDQKLQSLIDSIQRATDEIADNIHEIRKEIEEIKESE